MGKLYEDPSDLKEGVTLGQNDFLFFFGTYLTVENCYLQNYEGYGENNFFIFEKFGINKPFSFCEKIYGYAPKYGHRFPETKIGDYQALTRLVLAFINLYQGKEVIFLKKRVSFVSWWEDYLYAHLKELEQKKYSRIGS